MQADHKVVLCRDIDMRVLSALLRRVGLDLFALNEDTAIPGSYWGDSEAGLIGDQLYCRPDTPVHSVLHEASHYICMDDARRAVLDRDAGGDFDEENAVCLLQILLADHVPSFGVERMLQDMDTWGYTFRLGSARAWYEQESHDARQWLQTHGVIDGNGLPSWQVRK